MERCGDDDVLARRLFAGLRELDEAGAEDGSELTYSAARERGDRRKRYPRFVISNRGLFSLPQL